MTFPAKVTRQLTGSIWGPFNCWIATTRGLIAFASGGKVHVDDETARKRSGRWVAHPSHADLERLGPGNLVDIKRVLQHPDTIADFKRAGLHPPKVRDLENTKAATVFSYLRRGYQAAVAIKYSTLRELRPKAAGSTSFNDGHSVRWYGWFSQDGKPATTAPFFTDQLDPLDDGRYAGIAQGPQRLNRRVLVAETGDVEFHDAHGNVIGHVGRGRVLALVVKAADPIAPQDPGHVDPPPADDCAAKDLEIARLQGVIRTIGTALTDTQAPLNVIAGLVTDPANAGAVDQ